MVYTVDMVYTIDMVHTVDMVYAVKMRDMRQMRGTTMEKTWLRAESFSPQPGLSA